MDKAVVKRLLIAANVALAIAVVITIGLAIGSSSQSVVETEQSEATTAIAIIAAAPNAFGDRIDAWVKNVGLGPISPIEKSEIFVITPDHRLDAMTYSATGGDNTWVEDPVGSPWTPGGTLHVIIILPAASPLAVGNHVLKVSTPNGITVDKTFGR